MVSRMLPEKEYQMKNQVAGNRRRAQRQVLCYAKRASSLTTPRPEAQHAGTHALKRRKSWSAQPLVRPSVPQSHHSNPPSEHCCHVLTHTCAVDRFGPPSGPPSLQQRCFIYVESEARSQHPIITSSAVRHQQLRRPQSRSNHTYGRPCAQTHSTRPLVF